MDSCGRNRKRLRQDKDDDHLRDMPEVPLTALLDNERTKQSTSLSLDQLCQNGFSRSFFLVNPLHFASELLSGKYSIGHISGKNTSDSFPNFSLEMGDKNKKKPFVVTSYAENYIPRASNSNVDSVNFNSSVSHAQGCVTGALVTIKPSRVIDPSNSIPAHIIRDISIGKMLGPHLYISQASQVILKKGDRCIWQMYDKIDQALAQLMKFQHSRRGVSILFTCFHIRQLLSGLLFCHQLGVIHGSVRPDNLFLDFGGKLSLTDFSTASFLPWVWGDMSDISQSIVKEYSNYTAPEILMGKHESFASDMWSVGCILCELLSPDCIPPFGQSIDFQYENLMKIFRVLGTPTEDTCPGVTSLPYYCKAWPKWAKSPVNVLMRQDVIQVTMEIGYGPRCVDPIAYDLVRRLLVLNSDDRLSAEEALLHPFFDMDRLCAMENSEARDMNADAKRLNDYSVLIKQRRHAPCDKTCILRLPDIVASGKPKHSLIGVADSAKFAQAFSLSNYGLPDLVQSQLWGSSIRLHRLGLMKLIQEQASSSELKCLLDWEHRVQLVSFVIDVSYEVGLSDSTLFSSLLIMDRVFYMNSNLKFYCSNLEFYDTVAIAVACLLLACKLSPFDNFRKVLEFCSLIDFSIVIVIEMEWLIVRLLSFHMIVPSVFDFAEIFLSLLQQSIKLPSSDPVLSHSIMTLLVTSSVLDNECNLYRPSSIAFACVVFVIHILHGDNVLKSNEMSGVFYKICERLASTSSHLSTCLSTPVPYDTGVSCCSMLDRGFPNLECCLRKVQQVTRCCFFWIRANIKDSHVPHSPLLTVKWTPKFITNPRFISTHSSLLQYFFNESFLDIDSFMMTLRSEQFDACRGLIEHNIDQSVDSLMTPLSTGIGSTSLMVTSESTDDNKTANPFLRLPHELWLSCISLLSIAQEGVLSKTSTFFNVLVKHPKSRSIVNLDSYEHLIDNKFLTTVLPRWCNIQSLSFRRSPNLLSVSFEHIAEINGSTLEEISFLECVAIGEGACNILAKHCKNLKKIRFSHCHQINDTCLEILSRRVTNLLSLRLDGHWEHVTDIGLKFFFTKCRNLTCLDLSMCRRLTEPTIVQLISECSNLISLDLMLVSVSGARTVHCISETCKNLTSLNLARNIIIDDGLISDICSNLVKLRSLNLVGLASLTDLTLQHLIRLPLLESVNLFNCDQISRHGLAQYHSSCPNVSIVPPDGIFYDSDEEDGHGVALDGATNNLYFENDDLDVEFGVAENYADIPNETID